MAKNTGKAGSISRINDPSGDEIQYTLNDLLYLYGRKEYLDKLLKFIISYKYRHEAGTIVIKKLYDDHKIDYHVGESMKALMMTDENGKWIYEGSPTMKNAIALALDKLKRNRKNTEAP